MKFTGERYQRDVENPEIAYEHWHRYLYARQFAGGKRVLDIASGEGYGSHLLAGCAASVVGVDASAEAVSHAQRTYQLPNLSFRQGNVEDLSSFSDGSLDLVVSFETIEHVSAEPQVKFLAEVKRVLAKEGLLIVSTPDKLIYSDKPDYHNEYHRREFYRQEFLDFLGKFFGHIRALGQRTYPTSYLWPLTSNQQQPVSEVQIRQGSDGFSPASADEKEAMYLLAVCSDQPIALPAGSLLLDTSDVAMHGRRVQLIEKQNETTQLQERLAERESVSAEFTRVADRIAERIDAQNALLESLGKRIETISRRQRRYERRADNALHELHWAMLAASAGQAHASASAEAADYAHVVSGIRESVRTSVPRQARILVISKGDDTLLRFPDRHGAHFPQGRDGGYAGYYPANSTAAIAQLEALRADGFDYLVLPKTSFWWLDHYKEFRRHLDSHFRIATRRDDSCLIYALCEPADETEQSWEDRLDAVLREFERRYSAPPAILDWDTGLSLRQLMPERTVFSPPVGGPTLPYKDAEVDIVVVALPDDDRLAEARRVCRGAVVIVSADEGDVIKRPPLRAEWRESVSSTLASASIIMVFDEQPGDAQRFATALCASLPTPADVEIIVVASHSSDALRNWEKRDGRVRVLQSPVGESVAASSNRGAGAAHKNLLIFLGSDVQPLDGWFGSLLRTFDDWPDAGVVSGRILNRDGTLLEAGGVVFCDGSHIGFGQGAQDVDAPPFAHVRDVDFCSSSLMATPRSVFEKIGGFDAAMSEAGAADVDYCLKTTTSGKRVLVQPECVATRPDPNGRSAESGAALIRARWGSSLLDRPMRPELFDLDVWYALAARDPFLVNKGVTEDVKAFETLVVEPEGIV